MHEGLIDLLIPGDEADSMRGEKIEVVDTKMVYGILHIRWFR